MKTYKVDLDYEAYLFDPEYKEQGKKYQKLVREFEYVFFLVEKELCQLKNLKAYEKSYLSNLEKLGFILPTLAPTAEHASYWWGHRGNKEVEQRLNSKLTSVELAKKNQWGFFHGAIIYSLGELQEHLRKYPHFNKWLLKRPYSFSGLGHFYFDRQTLDEQKLKNWLIGPILLEPVYERVFDIGTTFIIENGRIKDEFMVLNSNNSRGSFKGGVGSHHHEIFSSFILKKFGYNLGALKKVTREIALAYIEMGATSNVQIDSFIYYDENELKMYPLVEVNYRKTMGLVIHALAKKWKHFDLVEWKILERGSDELAALDSVWIKLSPEDNYFHSFLKATNLS